MSEGGNGFEQYRREINRRLDNLESDVKEISTRTHDLEVIIANLRGRVFVWGTIAGTLFGAAVSLFVLLIVKQMGS